METTLKEVRAEGGVRTGGRLPGWGGATELRNSQTPLNLLPTPWLGLLPPTLCPQAHSPCLHCYPENRFISTIFLDSVYVR